MDVKIKSSNKDNQKPAKEVEISHTRSSLLRKQNSNANKIANAININYERLFKKAVKTK